MILPAAIDLYLSAVALHCEPVTADNYRERLTRFSTWLQKRTVTRALVLEYRDSLVRQKMARSSVVMHISSLRTFYRWLADHGHIAVNPVPRLRGEEGSNVKRKEGFTFAEYSSLLHSPHDWEYWGYAIRLGWATGFRLGDVALLRAESIDLKLHTITIIPKKTKRSWSKIVEIPICDEFAQFLQAMDADQFGYICPAMASQYLADGHKTLSAQFCALCRSLGINKGYHCWRHAFISRLISEGVNPALVAEMAGITLNRVMTYVSTPLEVKRAAIGKIINLKEQAA